MSRLRAIASCGKAQRAGLPVYFDMTHAYSVIGWARMRAYAVTRLSAPINAKDSHFALLMLVSVFLSGAVLYQVIFLSMPVSRLDVVMELVALLYLFAFLLQVGLGGVVGLGSRARARSNTNRRRVRWAWRLCVCEQVIMVGGLSNIEKSTHFRVMQTVRRSTRAANIAPVEEPGVRGWNVTGGRVCDP